MGLACLRKSWRMEPLGLEDVFAFVKQRFEASDVEALPSGTWPQAFALTVGAEPLVLRIGGFLGDYELDQVVSGWTRARLAGPRGA